MCLLDFQQGEPPIPKSMQQLQGGDNHNSKMGGASSNSNRPINGGYSVAGYSVAGRGRGRGVMSFNAGSSLFMSEKKVT